MKTLTYPYPWHAQKFADRTGSLSPFLRMTELSLLAMDANCLGMPFPLFEIEQQRRRYQSQSGVFDHV